MLLGARRKGPASQASDTSMSLCKRILRPPPLNLHLVPPTGALRRRDPLPCKIWLRPAAAGRGAGSRTRRSDAWADQWPGLGGAVAFLGNGFGGAIQLSIMKHAPPSHVSPSPSAPSSSNLRGSIPATPCNCGREGRPPHGVGFRTAAAAPRHSLASLPILNCNSLCCLLYTSDAADE